MMPTLSTQDLNYWIIDWLGRQDPATWHGYVEAADWNSGEYSPLFWIARQPDCDRATAASMFWLAEPSYYLDGQNDKKPLAQLCLEIAERWQSGHYRTERFDFGGDYMDQTREGWTTGNFDGPHEIPLSLADPISGGEPFPNFSRYDLAEPMFDWYHATAAEPPANFLAKHGLAYVSGQLVGERPTTRFDGTVTERPGKMGAESVVSVREKLKKHPPVKQSRGFFGRLFG